MVHLSPSPESFELIFAEKGRSPGSLFLSPSHPDRRDSGMDGQNSLLREQLTVAGTAPDSHRIPI